MDAAIILENRYADLAESLMKVRSADPEEVERLRLIAGNCRNVPENGERIIKKLFCFSGENVENAPF